MGADRRERSASTATPSLTEIRRRARTTSRRRPAAPSAATVGPAPPTGVASLRDLEPFALPSPECRARRQGAAKRLVYRLTYWQLAPLVQHVNRLHRAVAHDLPEEGEGDGHPPAG